MVKLAARNKITAYNNVMGLQKQIPIATHLAAYKYTDTRIERRFSDEINRKYSHNIFNDNNKPIYWNWKAKEKKWCVSRKLKIECAFSIRNSWPRRSTQHQWLSNKHRKMWRKYSNENWYIFVQTIGVCVCGVLHIAQSYQTEIISFRSLDTFGIWRNFIFFSPAMHSNQFTIHWKFDEKEIVFNEVAFAILVSIWI